MSAGATPNLGAIGDAAVHSGLFRPRLAMRRAIGWGFALACSVLSFFSLFALIVLLVYVVRAGWSVVSFKFLIARPSSMDPDSSGIVTALCGTGWLMLFTTALAVPIGVGAAIYLQEYTRPNRFTRFLALNIANLAGVPSIVYGILGFAVFVHWISAGRSVLTGALTLTLLVLPVIIISAKEALSAVPKTLREAAYAVGATRWQTVWYHVLPAALPGIMTGVILSLSRAIGETAPLLLVGGVAYVTHVPGGDLPHSLAATPEWFRGVLSSEYTAIPIQVYDWSKEAQDVFHTLAAGAIIVLLGVLLSLNAVASGIRAWRQNQRTY